MIFFIGFAYRLTFIHKGWAATDEGWLQALGARIADGQVPYRDFVDAFPPVTAYKEAVLAVLLNGNWTVLASRWLYAIEVSVASALAFLILRRFVSDRAAFLATLPTIFFSVIILAFTSYTYDAEFMALLSITLVVYSGEGGRRSRAMAVGSGIAAALAVMSKESFLAFLPAIPFAALAGAWLRRGSTRPVHPAVRALQTGWPWYVAGVAAAFAVIVGYFAAEGALSQFGYQAFLLEAQAHPVTRQFILIQDFPDYITLYDGWFIPQLVGVIVLLLAFGIGRAYELTRSVLLAGVLFFILVKTLRHPPPPSRPFFVIAAYGVLVVLGLTALVVTIVLEGPWLRNRPTAEGMRSRLFPPELVFLALFIQWLAQFHYDGLVFWYEGAWLTVPVVLLFLHAFSRMSFSLHRSSALHLRLAVPAAASVLLGLWFAAGGAGIVQVRAYEDAMPSQLTAGFNTPVLHGINGYPVTQQRTDALVVTVLQLTKPGDPIFFFPDFGLLYEATGRRNPTRIDWYNEAFLTPAVTAQVLADLARDPPKVVFLQYQREGAAERDQAPIDWAHSKWAPIYDYLVAHYTQGGSVQDIKVMVTSSQ
ncbi:MAG TPA: hypothetical protein VGU71_16110 [Candidatus Dormibacteraeota bacterium]|nr:hypothetical protein [Candidatus Dormibacteraeota bacterium]